MFGELIKTVVQMFIGACILLLFTAWFAWIILTTCVYGNSITASWYSVESCRREGTSGIMANGRKLKDETYVAASWDYEFGTMLKVTNLENGKMVWVEVCDRGPSRKLYRQGRVLDLSMAAFSAIADLKEGVIPISIERSK